ncbi:protein tyrosine phosphatase family protein [Ramlibacter sp. PS4R-6]|uniref:protein tyrosine phosphatase family protein n=1 Tax=Ramlibacter sp. PS4R-6 TaxID=3133438 RepID=UPI0030B799A8
MATPAFASIHNWRAVDARLGTSGQPTEAQLADIAAAGYRTVINLALHDDPRYSLPDERAAVEALGMDYVHIPVQFASPQDEDLSRFFAAMDAHRERKVWVHCAANMRVSAFLGLYWTLRDGRPREEAFELLRGLWQPNETWSAFIERSLQR